MSSYALALICLILGNLMASLSDVAVKLLDGEVAAFQYVFLRQLIALMVTAPFYLYSRSQEADPPQSHWKLHAMRGQLIVLGAACMLVAVTHLPLATANAVFYAGPLLMLPLSLWLLKEVPPRHKVIATTVGFVGVLVVLRPSQFHWAALFALGTATTLALFHILVRKLPANSPLSHTLFWTSLYSLPLSGLLGLTNWNPMTTEQWLWMAASSLAVLAYNGLAVMAYKRAHASQIALAEYSGLVFVVLFGVLWFDEVPDLLTLCGIGLIILPLLPRKSLLRTIKLTADS